MSGRRRRDDGWDDGRLDAQDERRDPWADDTVGEWGGHGVDFAEAADRSSRSAGGSAGAYVRNAPSSGKTHAAPDFPSFQIAGASSGDDRYGSGSGHGGQRGLPNGYAPNGQAPGGHGADGYRDQGAGYDGTRDRYQEVGFGRGTNRGEGAGRGDAAGYDAGESAASGYGGSANGSVRSGYGGGAGYDAANGRSAGLGYASGFTPADNDEAEDDASGGTPRPYGRLSIYTLHDDKAREFDRLAERAAEGVRTREPDTLVYVIHVVPKAAQQRIIYEIYRDRAAFMSHERQPHIRQFAADRVSCVLATNIIDLRLKYAKVAALSSTSDAARSRSQAQASWSTQGAQTVQGGDRYAPAPQYAPGQYSPAPQYTSGQYAPPEPQRTGTVAASFTPAAEQYGAGGGQYPTVGPEAYSPVPQYGNSGTAAYAAGNGQYDAANSNGYSGAVGYANGGSYSSNGYPGANGYQSVSGYPGGNGYSGASGYQSVNGYSGTNGYPNGNGYQSANGYGGGSGYPDGSGYGAAAANGGNNGYGAVGGYPEAAGPPTASASTQYTPRYRELTSGSAAGATGHTGNGGRYADDGRQSARPSEWDERPHGHQ